MNKLKLITNLILLVLILFFLTKDLDLFKITKILQDLNLFYFFISFFICLIFPIILSIRWKVINQYFGFNINLIKSLNIIIMGQAGSSITGISIVNEIIKFFTLNKKIKILNKFKILILDKIFSILIKLLLIFLIIPFFFEIKNYIYLLSLFLFLFCFFIIICIIHLKGLSVVAKTFFLSFVHNLLIIITYLCICKSLNINISFYENILFLSVELITQIFSLWGVREISATYVINLINLSGEVGLSIALIFTIVNLFSLTSYILILKSNLLSKFK